jgi:ABC-type molybdate transport system substrate-binding protein
LRARLETAAADEAEREAARLAAMFAAGRQLEFQENLNAVGAASGAGKAEVTASAPEASLAPDADAEQRIAELKDGLATFAFASAELAAAYEARNHAFNELALRGATSDSHAATAIVGEQAAPAGGDNAAQLEDLKTQYAALNDKLKAIDAGLDELAGLRLEAGDRLIGGLAKLTMLKGIISRLNTEKADLEGDLRAGEPVRLVPGLVGFDCLQAYRFHLR